MFKLIRWIYSLGALNAYNDICKENLYPDEFSRIQKTKESLTERVWGKKPK